MSVQPPTLGSGQLLQLGNMKKIITTANGDVTISTSSIYTPDEGGLVIEFSKSIDIDGQSYSQGTKIITIPKDATTDLISEYILSYIE